MTLVSYHDAHSCDAMEGPDHSTQILNNVRANHPDCLPVLVMAARLPAYPVHRAASNEACPPQVNRCHSRAASPMAAPPAAQAFPPVPHHAISTALQTHARRFHGA